MSKNLIEKFEKYFDTLKKEMKHVLSYKELWNKKDFLMLLISEVKLKKFKRGESIFVCGLNFVFELF